MRARVQAAGNFHWSSVAQDGDGPLLLIAGGLGVNPLFSILAHCHELAEQPDEERPVVTLLYCARTEADLTHRAEIEAIAEDDPLIEVIFTTTGKALEASDGSEDEKSDEGSEGDTILDSGLLLPPSPCRCPLRRGRIDKPLLSEALDRLCERQAVHISGGAASLDAKVGAEEKRAVRCYLCGPAGMIEGSAALALELGLDDNLLNYEQWW